MSDTTTDRAYTTIVLINEDTVGHTIHCGVAGEILDRHTADPALKAAVQRVVDGEAEATGRDAEGCQFTVTLQSRQYRCYETTRNAAGGLDPVGNGSTTVTAETAQDAADERAASLRDYPECHGQTVVATDDNGDSATADV